MRQLLFSSTVTVMLVATIGWTQSAFEVGTVKSDPGCTARPRTAQILSPGRLNLECITLRDLVEYAYGVGANAANRIRVT